MSRVLTLACVLACVLAAPAQARSTPQLSVKGTLLYWTSTSPQGHYVVEAGGVDVKVPGERARSGKVSSWQPPAAPGRTVSYRVRPAAWQNAWSNVVQIVWPAAEEPPREEEHHEEPPREEPPPAEGPKVAPAPAAGTPVNWRLVYGDAFAGPSLDSTWVKGGPKSQGCCNNGNEIAAETPDKARVSEAGLELLCSHEAREGKAYDCGGVETSHFNWKPGGGQTWAFQVVMRLPARDGGEDPGWWSTDHSWTDELDYLEGWEWGHVEYFAGIPVWKAVTPNVVEVSHESYALKSEIPNPEEGLHTYTTVVKANNEAEEWIDGTHRWNVAAPSRMNVPWMHLILTHALRQATTLSESVFLIRSVSVYEDAAHVGQNVEGGGVAPGTVVG